jgi:hypothetical protein
MRPTVLIGTLGLLLVGLVWDARSQSSETSSQEEQRVTLDMVQRKEREMMNLIQEYNNLIEKAKKASSYEEKKQYMDRAERLWPEIRRVEQEYLQLHQIYTRQTRTPPPHPEADKVLRQIQDLEREINTLVDQVNDRILWVEQETDPEARERARRDIDRLKRQIEEKKSQRMELLRRYQELLRAGREKKTPGSPKEEKAKPPR